jgi:hypothetical protein
VLAGPFGLFALVGIYTEGLVSSLLCAGKFIGLVRDLIGFSSEWGVIGWRLQSAGSMVIVNLRVAEKARIRGFKSEGGQCCFL